MATFWGNFGKNWTTFLFWTFGHTASYCLNLSSKVVSELPNSAQTHLSFTLKLPKIFRSRFTWYWHWQTFWKVQSVAKSDGLSQNKTSGQSYFFKWANPGLFFVYFWSFQTNIITIFTTNICEKCPSNPYRTL